MSTYDLVKDLTLEIEDVEFETCELRISDEFTRRTTIVKLRSDVSGAEQEGRGEDVTYDPAEHDPQKLPRLELQGSWTLDSLSKRLDELDLFPRGEPAQTAYRDYRRWSFESAALDLALIQAGRSLGDVLGREARPVRFVSSTRASSLDDWLTLYPELRFKLDPTPDWTDETIAALAARGNVDTADLKGAYHGTAVDNPPNPELYRRVAEGLPGVWIEDPALTPETDAVLEPYRDRITWDAPIHSWADVEALPFAPALPEQQAVALRLGRAPVRVLRPLRGTGDLALRRRAVRARRRPRPHPAPRRALPPGRAERRGARRLQRACARSRARGEPARPAPVGDRFSSGVVVTA